MLGPDAAAMSSCQTGVVICAAERECACLCVLSWRTLNLSECKCQRCHGSIGVVVNAGSDCDATKSVLMSVNCRGACGGGAGERCDWLRSTLGNCSYASPGVRCR